MKLCLPQPPIFELSGDDVVAESIFEDDDGPEDGDGGTTMRAADPTPSETSDDDDAPLITSILRSVCLLPQRGLLWTQGR